MTDLSVLIPTWNRPDKLETCLRCLDAQGLASDRFEVVVGIDGPDQESIDKVGALRQELSLGERIRCVAFPKIGYIAVRNALQSQLTGDILVSLNDDVRPEPDFLEAHLIEQRRRLERNSPAIVVGYSPWVVHQDGRLIDRIVRETAIVFFYSNMLGEDPERDWGYRHCFGLNFSAPMACVREVGGFCAMPQTYGYDDIELAYRLQARLAMPVIFREGARAPHDHRYSAQDLVGREKSLGVAAWRFGRANPAFCRDLFQRDINTPEELSYCEEFVRRELDDARRIEASFLDLDEIPADAIGGEASERLIRILSQQWTLLKRFQWRCGLLAAAMEGRSTLPMVA